MKDDNISLSDLKGSVLGVKLENEGSGIVIGQIESGSPDKSKCSDLENSNISYLNSNSNKTNHATAVANILVGSNGIAPKASLVSCALSDSGMTFYKAVDDLVEKNVNVINMSSGYYGSRQGTYDSYSKYVDYIIKENNVCFVKSAGNYDDKDTEDTSDDDTKISSPGMAYNAITVGNCDLNLTKMSSSSLYKHDSGVAQKPDVVAPGMKIDVGVTGYATASGTSFSTPAVTGVVAVLMANDENLITRPYLVKSLLASGASLGTASDLNILSSFLLQTISGQTSKFTEKAGAGIINGDRSKTAKYATRAVSSSDVEYTSSKSFAKGKKIRIAIAWDMYATATDHSATISPSEYSVTIKQGDTIIGKIGNASTYKNNMFVVECTTISDNPLTFVLSRTSGSKSRSLAISYIQA